MTDESILIREAKISDMPAVLALIRELAEYERAPNDVIVTVEDLERDGFSDCPKFYCFVAKKGESIVGIALYYISYSTWKGPCIFLEDIVVTMSERKKGIGKMLFDEVLRAAKKTGAKRMQWQVLDWNEPAIKFYEKYSPLVMTEWLNYRIVIND